MTVISDASPLVSLSRIEALELLPTIYGTVTLPDAVWNEVVVDAEKQPGAKAIRNASWIETQATGTSCGPSDKIWMGVRRRQSHWPSNPIRRC